MTIALFTIAVLLFALLIREDLKNHNHKFLVCKAFLCLYILKYHRHVFDKQYLQTYQITLKDRPVLLWYDFLTKLKPDFRQYLKKWKRILNRAYNQKRLSYKYQMIFWILRTKNLERYTDYLNA